MVRIKSGDIVEIDRYNPNEYEYYRTWYKHILIIFIYIDYIDID